VLDLICGNGCTITETAKTLGVSPEEVKKMVRKELLNYRGKKK
jgi:hypothetical protein